MRPADALASADKASPDDAASAAYWLTHPDAPARHMTIADLLNQWESEPKWKDTDQPCPE
jgi:hypothetical protein